MEPAQKKQTLLRTSHHEHSHAFSFSKPPLVWRELWSSKVHPSPKASLARGRGGDSSATGPGFAGSSLCQAEAPVKRDRIKTSFELFQHKILSLLPALVPLFPWTMAAPTPLELCVGHSAELPLPAEGKTKTSWSRESCQHRRQSANIQTIFLMIYFLIPWKEDEGFKTTMKLILFNLGQCSNAWDAKAPGEQAETSPFGECKMNFWLLLTTSQIVLALLLLQFESMQCFLSKNHLGAI